MQHTDEREPDTPEPESHQLGNAPTGLPKLPLGQVVATPGALSLAISAGVNLWDLLRRHASGDWGSLCPEDWEANDQALGADPGRVLSRYPVNGSETPLWIITEWDRSVTTILLPDEY